jgi:predicted small secreted protein
MKSNLPKFKVKIMQTFQQLQREEKLQELLYTAFGVELDVSGGWGYTQEEVTVLHDLSVSVAQVGHVFATCRAYLEMNMTLSEEERYGSINLNEKEHQEFTIEGMKYHCIAYEITAMKELAYKAFIDEYKENSENPDFDMGAHFSRRKEATLVRNVEHWFKVVK